VTIDLRTAHKRLRYTGRFPPLRELCFANWELALDEEGRKGQDETTLRPCLEQRFIARETAWTAAEARLADGESLPALVCIDLIVPPNEVAIFFQRRWLILRRPFFGRRPWHMFSVSRGDTEAFNALKRRLPAWLQTRLARAKGARPWRFRVKI
jgi:hypothetical protein